jgi:hypothetical protein
MGDGRKSLMPVPNYNTPVKDLTYKDLLTSIFTYSVECHMDPNIGKVTTGKERTVSVCKESLPTSRGPHRNRCLEVQTEIRDRMVSDKKTLLTEEVASAKRNYHIQCFTCPTHAIDGSIKNISTSKEEIGTWNKEERINPGETIDLYHRSP